MAGRSTECASLIRGYIEGLGVKGKATLIGEDTLLPAEYAGGSPSEPPFVPNQILVSFHPGVTLADIATSYVELGPE